MISRYLVSCLSGLLSLMIVMTLQAADANAVETPSEVRIAVMYSVGPEDGWDKTLQEALDRVAAKQPNGLEVKYRTNDAVYGDEAEQIMRLLAKSGKYDIIVSATAHSDQIKNLQGEYPDIMWVSLGSGNYHTGANHYLAYGRVHEAAYLLGMLSAGMSKTGVVGVVASYPAEDINDQINAYKAGAQAVRSDAKLKLTFIESWYDPPKAIEATYAQVAAGADVVFQMAGEVYEACKSKGIYCLGNYKDTASLAPDVVLSGTLIMWDPVIEWAIDEWYQHKTQDVPFNGNSEPRWFAMAEGGADISPYHDLADRVPDDLKAKIEEKKAEIISGEFEVPLNVEMPVSN